MADGNPSKGLAARLFSSRLDGTGVEVHCGGGMDNPVELIFTPDADVVGTVAIFDSKPQRKDALVHWVWGGVYPYDPRCYAEFRRTGDLMPSLSTFGQVAPSGLLQYRGVNFGTEYVGSLFHAQFNTHKIIRTELVREGSSWRSRETDFLVSEDVDFHPVEVLEDADGSMLMVDTGGWFRIGCPLSQIAKPDVDGMIYRIRRTAAPKVVDSRGLSIDWRKTSAETLVALLDDPRPMVRDRALASVAATGEAAVPALRAVLAAPGAAKTSLRVQAGWALCRIETTGALQGLREAAADPDPTVRKAVVHALGVRRDHDGLAVVVKLAADADPAVRREAAVALGKLKAESAVPTLLAALRQAVDRHLEHAILYALIEIK
ncbi:MAG: HEAT repeat domain-containing protein, partial [Planctomycetia bacterium]